jgi:putative transposase
MVLEGGNLALGTVIGAYKAAVTRQIRRECTKAPSMIWHGRYHDRIMRNERALEQIREYILYNPMRWQAN